MSRSPRFDERDSHAPPTVSRHRRLENRDHCGEHLFPTGVRTVLSQTPLTEALGLKLNRTPSDTI